MRRALSTLAGVLVLALGGAAPALAEAPAPWWRVGTEVSPSNLPPEHEGEKGTGTGEIIVVASDLGGGSASGAAGHPVVISDTLPAGLAATSVSNPTVNGVQAKCVLETPQHAQCTYAGVLYPYQRLAVAIKVNVEEPEGTVTTLPTEVVVEGGGAAHAASSIQQVRISGAPTPFGVQAHGYELAPYDQDGTPATQAGAHPFELTSTLVLNQTGAGSTREPVALPRNLRFQLPLGLVGDPQASEQCPTSDFFAHAPVSEVDECPPGAVVGVAIVTIDEPEVAHVITLTAPVFNLVPSEGEPARFGFEALGLVPVIIETAVDPGDDYGVVASVKNATEIAGLLSSQVTLWGVPGDPSHNSSRGWECVDNGYHYEKGEVSTPCPASSVEPETPFLTLPTSCPADPSSEPLSSSAQAESWTQPGHVVESEYSWSGPLQEPLGFAGCGALPFEPSIETTPQQAVHTPPVHAGAVPAGLKVSVKVPQSTTVEANPQGLAEADVRDTTVTLPEGVQVNPSAANGLQACPQTPAGGHEGIGFTGFQKFYGAEREPGPETATFTPTFRFSKEEAGGEMIPSSCPEGSKVGVVHIKTPLLPRELEGALYLAEPAPKGEAGKNPFDSLVALYLVAEDKEAGVLVKLAGEGKLEPGTGRVSTTFKDTPQLPFEELTVELFGGQRASLSTPASCGSYSTEASFTPWSAPPKGAPTVTHSPGSEFAITEGCSNGPLPFSPAFDAQVTNTTAGAFTNFQLEIARPDGDQALSGVEVRLPPGVAALLSTLTPCQEPSSGQPWACGRESEIGQSNAESGLGSEPVVLPPGKAYLTSGYDGAPFGLLVETEAKAGPFDLGIVYVRSRINVNPETAAVTITTDPGPHGDALPSMLDGIPVQLKRLLVNVEREHFEFNPTSCDPMRIEGTLSGSQGASAGVSSPFQVGGCQSLPFSPTLTASTTGHASKADGTNLNVTVTSAGVGQANIAKVDLQLPKALSSRLTTLQKACTEAAFNTNPASCDPESVIGHATVHTPVLTSPLSGPAYLVSHGGAAFPDVEFVLQGEGVEILLDGKTDIKDGITYSKFESAPDAPFTTFETELPAGPDSIFTANVPEKEDFNLCKASLAMPTRIVAQDGAVIEASTKIAVQGCGAVQASKVKKLTRAQELTKALKLCRKHFKHKRKKRVACEKQARKRYAPKISKKKASKKAPKTKHHG